MPYKPQHRPKVAGMCAYFESLNATGSSFPNMDRFIIGSYKSSGIAGAGNQAKYLSLIKELLRHRHAIASPGSCPKTLTRRYSPRTACFYPNSGHGQMIVGYDDSLGALLVQKQHGRYLESGAQQ